MKRTVCILATLAALLAATPALANMGVPMVALFLPPLWLALVPVILVEAWALSRLLPLGRSRSIAGAAVGNIVTTIVGIPLMWAAMAAVQLAFAGTALGLSTLGSRIYAVTVQAPWLIPYNTDLGWMIPIALAVLAVPAYALSVLVEWWCLLPFIPLAQRSGALRAVGVANLASYVLLAALFGAVMGAGNAFNPISRAFEPLTMWLIEHVFSAAQFLVGKPPE